MLAARVISAISIMIAVFIAMMVATIAFMPVVAVVAVITLPDATRQQQRRYTTNYQLYQSGLVHLVTS